MPRSDFYEWRSPSRILEVTIHRVCYPITESVLHQVFGSFGGIVEQILVIAATGVVVASLAFDFVEDAADAYGELHGRHIYDDCCQMLIKWGLPTPAAFAPSSSSSVASSPPTAVSVAPAPAAALAPVATSLVVHAPPASTWDAPVATPPATAPATTAPPSDASSSVTSCAISIELDCHIFTREGHDQAPLHQVNLDALPVVLTLDAVATAVSSIWTEERV
jgi:pyruvate/2-oxoglutarate dehydrogenase complex dihydrolipoamide acyltransferase (E2) component